jgi:hypothetical protein
MHIHEHTCRFLKAAREDDNWKCLMCDPIPLRRAQPQPNEVGSLSSGPVESAEDIGVASSSSSSISSSSSSSSSASSSSHSNGTGGRVVIDID